MELAAAASFAALFNTAVGDHREFTHGSTAYRNKLLGQFTILAGGHLTDRRRWASSHRIHHATADANLLPFVLLADYVDFIHDPFAKNSGHPDIPDFVYGYDPAVNAINFNTAYEIGSLARELVEGKYQPKTEFSPIEGVAILESPSDKFWYESDAEMKRDRQNPIKYDPDNPPSLNQIRFLLRDPHSPALDKRGIPGILRTNVSKYAFVERNFEDPFFRDEDLQPDDIERWVRQNRSKLRYAYVGGMALAGVIRGGGGSPAKMLGNALTGATASGAGVGMLIAGGNITNSFGHAGDWKQLTLETFMDGKVYPKPDGTYSSNSKLLSGPTLDEVGAQEVHHRKPWLIAYTEKLGLAGILEAPFGKFLETMVKLGIVFEEGHQFDGGPRPDLPSEAVLLLEDYRRHHMPNGVLNPDSPTYNPNFVLAS